MTENKQNTIENNAMNDIYTEVMDTLKACTRSGQLDARYSTSSELSALVDSVVQKYGMEARPVGICTATFRDHNGKDHVVMSGDGTWWVFEK